MKWSENASELLMVFLIVFSIAGCTAVKHVSNNDKEVKLKEIEMKYSQPVTEE